METIEIKLDKPVASPRPRFRRMGKYVRTYMPKSYEDHKQDIQWQLPMLMIDKPIKLELEFYFPPLKSWSKKKCNEMIGQYKGKKPDIDNLMKTVLDAANKHLWQDDGQIVEIKSFKRFSDNPRIVLKLEVVEG
ncbi:RusA family crossover junction endodeoxyribonuclease [Staphylococcus pettenkoferi]|uniref:RusA family crossover junction endodeoxyribonuclease n=1 Tax=Staphylococcus pettenkoferi TaxID=170573 RepID=UPI000CD164AE|nr:RusA family crossover junction endodeoxyribonuclease [Staphylococcus pettenkoferi]MCY1585609.1 RusA family crossover junction endodeoxyribonuclease [Staphylococcus pettenkoferi]PNZ87666.1 RusA family crossover junction endodeoxyribonuclease [Staphylococcus pettenkoferi]QQC36823.1 RusA family crossover junction endodeoxyribonuclease [Staphylococcus pettenkoferi]